MQIDPEAIIAIGDPREVERETTSLLEQVYWKANAIHKANIRSSLETRKADQIKGIIEAKKKASISGSGGNAPPAIKQKSFEEMTLSELDAAMRSLG
jgi:hypothetical protein